MGVHKLWDILEPSSKPVRLESLNDQRLAIDASIWLYQFLTAVRDNEGNAIQSSHITGFFRRVCKLLYFGVKPVFVFDGIVSPLKKETIKKRNERRQGKRDSASKTAKKILAMQLQNSLLSKGKSATPQKNNDTRDKSATPRSTNGTKHPRSAGKIDYNDEWELPKIEEFKYNKKDGRLSSVEEYQEVLHQIDDELTDVDLDSINPASKEFENLPASTQYMILYALRKKSRLRMGYSKEQLEKIFANSMDFSKFQIDMVKRRNFFTQKLLDSTGVHGQSHLTTGKISNEKNKEYQLLRTDTGWAMTLEQDDGSSITKAIKLDGEDDSIEHNGDAQDDDDGDWEDVDVSNVVKEEEVPDYSIKASLLATGGSASDINSHGNQAFLDKRAEQTHNKAYYSPYKRTVEFFDDVDDVISKPGGKGNAIAVRNNLQASLINASGPISSELKSVPSSSFVSEDEDDDDDDFKTLSNEVQQMEELNQTTRPAQKPSERLDVLQDESAQTKENEFPNLINYIDSNASSGDKTVREADETPAFSNNNTANGISSGSELGSREVDLASNGSIQSIETSQRKTKKPRVENTSPIWFKSVQGQKDEIESSIVVEDLDSGSRSDLEETIQRDTAKLKPKAAQDFSQFDQPAQEVIDLDDDFEDVDTSVNVEKAKTPDLGIFGFEPQLVEESKNPQEKPLVAENAQDEPYNYQFSEDEEDELKEQLQQEEEEYNNFLKPTIASQHAESTFIDNNEPEDYTELLERNRKEKRDADEVTGAMIKEVQELLSCFGIPYVTAPMEAEAQCAELLHLKLVDGIVTDDSDIFLFGGDSIYRKMFQEKNYVEYYSQMGVEGNLGLKRDGLIELAHLLGSDYTEGIKTIGPVSAIEILAHFGNLAVFRDWYNKGQFDIESLNKETPFEKTLRKRLVNKQVDLDSDNFPNARVTEAYLYPVVDQDKTAFVWGNPDLGQLRELLKGYAGWSMEKTDQVLVPLIRDMNKRVKEKKQRKVTDFFHQSHSSSSSVSGVGKRMQTAMSALKNKNTSK